MPVQLAQVQFQAHLGRGEGGQGEVSQAALRSRFAGLAAARTACCCRASTAQRTCVSQKATNAAGSGGLDSSNAVMGCLLLPATVL